MQSTLDLELNNVHIHTAKPKFNTGEIIALISLFVFFILGIEQRVRTHFHASELVRNVLLPLYFIVFNL
jgi:hypothetical protein